jgi:hypothetical protein
MNHQKFLQVNKLLKNIPETALKLHKRIHIYQNYPDMYLILYCMTCFIVLYLIYVIYYACRFEKLLRAYVVLL